VVEGARVPSDLTLRVKSLESLLVEKGLVDPAALDALIDTMEHKVGPRNVVWDSTAELRYLEQFAPEHLVHRFSTNRTLGQNRVAERSDLRLRDHMSMTGCDQSVVGGLMTPYLRRKQTVSSSTSRDHNLSDYCDGNWARNHPGIGNELIQPLGRVGGQGRVRRRHRMVTC